MLCVRCLACKPLDLLPKWHFCPHSHAQDNAETEQHLFFLDTGLHLHVVQPSSPPLLARPRHTLSPCPVHALDACSIPPAPPL